MKRRVKSRTPIAKGAVRRRRRGKTDPRIVVTYETYTPDDLEAGEPSESGFEDEEGFSVKPDRFDRAEGKTVVDLAVKELQRQGAYEPSSMPFYKGTWYSSYDDDYRTGERTVRNFHLDGFTEAQEREIYKRMTGRGR